MKVQSSFEMLQELVYLNLSISLKVISANWIQFANAKMKFPNFSDYQPTTSQLPANFKLLDFSQTLFATFWLDKLIENYNMVMWITRGFPQPKIRSKYLQETASDSHLIKELFRRNCIYSQLKIFAWNPWVLHMISFFLPIILIKSSFSKLDNSARYKHHRKIFN